MVDDVNLLSPARSRFGEAQHGGGQVRAGGGGALHLVHAPRVRHRADLNRHRRHSAPRVEARHILLAASEDAI